ncbi:hypothetical protein NDU88_011457 [Pleurodeles waltl]|uniref:Uncharacterized protein n=1 Tax=Pleurodeles waltl TaxID=8319 RepID=A0AAV7R1F3_PLEWA|nr:hypothetical protein NDU88_011457 [Pleurodeles waltl]
MQSHGAEDKRTRLSGFCSVILEPDFAHFLDTISITYFLCDISWIVFVEVGSTFEKLRENKTSVSTIDPKIDSLTCCMDNMKERLDRHQMYIDHAEQQLSGVEDDMAQWNSLLKEIGAAEESPWWALAANDSDTGVSQGKGRIEGVPMPLRHKCSAVINIQVPEEFVWYRLDPQIQSVNM